MKLVYGAFFLLVAAVSLWMGEPSAADKIMAIACSFVAGVEVTAWLKVRMENTDGA